MPDRSLDDDSEVTSASLLLGLCDQKNEQVWRRFCSRYRPVVVGFARRLGLGEQDAQDVAQEVLLAFMEAYQQGKYDRRKGRLRAWLLGIARKKILYLHRKQRRQIHVADKSGQTGFFERLPDENTINQVWEAQWRQAILRISLRELRRQLEPSTVRAFELVTLKEWPAERAAAELGMTANAVLKANRRALSRVRELYTFLEKEW
jgi:RNA polymerase sigma factor (sigma-70 family)